MMMDFFAVVAFVVVVKISFEACRENNVENDEIENDSNKKGGC